MDSAIRMGAAIKMGTMTSGSTIQGLSKWAEKFEDFKVLVTDKAPYYASESMAKWSQSRGIEQVFTTPYRHQSVGLVERFHKTLIDRIRTLRLAHGGSCSDS